MLKGMSGGFLIAVVFSSFLLGAQNSNRFFQDEKDKKSISFCLDQINKAVSLELIVWYQEYLVFLVQNGDKPLQHHLRFLHWQVHDQRLISCLEADPLWNQKTEVYRQILYCFSMAGYTYKVDQDDCIVS